MCHRLAISISVRLPERLAGNFGEAEEDESGKSTQHPARAHGDAHVSSREVMLVQARQERATKVSSQDSAPT